MTEPTGDSAPPLPDSAESPRPTRRRWLRRLLLLLVPVGLLLVFIYSGLGSWFSATLVAHYVRSISFAVGPGPSEVPARAPAGPYDLRLGYRALPEYAARLGDRGFTIAEQARVSERFNRVAGLGLFPPWREKTQAGLRLIGHHGALIAANRFPLHIYPTFDSIPAPVREALLFLENRELLDERFPYRNPAVEWDRFVAALANFAGARVLGIGGRFGASTLATQLEKLRHSPGGVTGSARDKAKQMASATLRSYLEGERTSAVRRQILMDYLNALPVGAQAGYGEVIGLRDGLGVWFGLDPDSADVALRATGGAPSPEAARAFRAVVMLLLAQRRPSHYLQTPEGRAALVSLTEAHLRLLADDSDVSPPLARAAGLATLVVRTGPPPPQPMSFVERKAINAARTHLRGLLDVSNLYQLDRLDLTARITFDSAAQAITTAMVRQLADPDSVRAWGLEGERLVSTADPGRIAYSVVLYEVTTGGNAVRVQVDNLDRPFDLNLGARLELGSTAKLRTLVTYLETLAELHAELSDSARAAEARSTDPITVWGRGVVRANPDIQLRPFLEAGLERRYAASPAETFFTGGGAHVFGNFDDTHDRETPTVLEGFRHSVNLVYVRLMRDLVRYREQRLPEYAPGVLTDPASPARRPLLQRFAEHEGRELIQRAWRRHRGLAPDSSLSLLLGAAGRSSPERTARMVMALAPEAPLDTVAAVVTRRFPDTPLSPAALQRIRQGFPATLELADRAFSTRTEPLELWVAAQLRADSSITLEPLQAAGDTARQEAYAWLFRQTPAVRRAQDRALRVTLERLAFEPIRASWRKVGYPYEDMVPSLGTSIGSSGDRPGALAELVGILLTDGVRNPVTQVEELRFGVGTPYETVLRREPARGVRVLAPEVAAVARMAMTDVVERGTAVVLRGAVASAETDSAPLVIGGKTGTGLNQVKTFGPGGRLLSARTTSRTATFVFFVGDRHYGVITAYVEGAAADQFRFTSALPVRVARQLLPRLAPVLLVAPAVAAPGG